jgi:hypothetical protein
MSDNFKNQVNAIVTDLRRLGTLLALLEQRVNTYDDSNSGLVVSNVAAIDDMKSGMNTIIDMINSVSARVSSLESLSYVSIYPDITVAGPIASQAVSCIAYLDGHNVSILINQRTWSATSIAYFTLTLDDALPDIDMCVGVVPVINNTYGMAQYVRYTSRQIFVYSNLTINSTYASGNVVGFQDCLIKYTHV